MKITSTLLTETERSNLVKILAKILPCATYSSDLTSDVTILVANPSRSSDWLQSRKFQYVVQYRPEVSIVKYEGILTCYEGWLRGEEDDSTKGDGILDSLTSVDVFEGLKVSISRLNESLDSESVDKLKELVEKHGGQVSESLSSDSDVLVSTIPEGRRYTKAKEWEIPIVSPDWCFDSVDRGSALGFKYYTLVKKYGKGRKSDSCDWDKLKAWREKDEEDRNIRRAKLEAALEGKRTGKRKSENEKKKKGEDYEERDLKVAKIDVKDRIWNSIMREASIGKVREGDGEDDGWETEQKVGLGEAETGSNEFKLLDRGMISSQNQEHPKRESDPLLFSGLKFSLYGFKEEEERILRVVLKEYGGIVAAGGEVDYVIISSEKNEDPNLGGRVITEFGIERCIYYHGRKALEDEKWSRPIFLRSDVEVSDFREALGLEKVDKKIQVAITGFKGIDLSEIERILRKKLVKGFEFCEMFNRECEMLIVGEDGGDSSVRKVRMGRKWGVRMVGWGEVVRGLPNRRAERGSGVRSEVHGEIRREAAKEVAN
ncbi:DEKNAAC105423 [Brettanomyces naardenensis]|uniref:DEKNAAC105423 n=1 Tax=Brettanomyces naardenensis TaxID=13370 RepID=A0A448YTF0_BRENA|nr:DEKNAAC105423 [Brettanomyces naardenensis]